MIKLEWYRHFLLWTAVTLAAIGGSQGGPLPLNNGRYVVNSELCFIDQSRMADAYGDRAGSLTRLINDDELADGYEMSCQVSAVNLTGSDLRFRAECSTEGETDVVDGHYRAVSQDAFSLRDQTFVRCGSPASLSVYDDGIETTSGDLLTLLDDADARCRGSISPDDARTVAACAERDAYSIMLQDRGWCHGQAGQAMYEKVWQLCEPFKTPQLIAAQNAPRPTVPPAPEPMKSSSPAEVETKPVPFDISISVLSAHPGDEMVPVIVRRCAGLYSAYLQLTKESGDTYTAGIIERRRTMFLAFAQNGLDAPQINLALADIDEFANKYTNLIREERMTTALTGMPYDDIKRCNGVAESFGF